MTAVKTKLFNTNKTQAVRLPKAVAFPPGVEEVEILVMGNSRIIVPAGRRWDDFFNGEPKVSDDFLIDRDQGVAEERDPF